MKYRDEDKTNITMPFEYRLGSETFVVAQVDYKKYMAINIDNLNRNNGRTITAEHHQRVTVGMLKVLLAPTDVIKLIDYGVFRDSFTDGWEPVVVTEIVPYASKKKNGKGGGISAATRAARWRADAIVRGTHKSRADESDELIDFCTGRVHSERMVSNMTRKVCGHILCRKPKAEWIEKLNVRLYRIASKYPEAMNYTTLSRVWRCINTAIEEAGLVS